VIFADVSRYDSTPATYSESNFEFLNRVDAPTWQRVRDLVEDWFTHLWDDAKPDVAARLQSRDDRQFRAAFWELYCHESLRRLGYDVECHPELSSGGRRPDFLARRDDLELVLEATIAASSDADVAAERREAQIYDVLNRVDSPNFFLAIEVHHAGSNPPAAARLKADLEQWLRTLDPDQVTQILEEEGTLLLSGSVPHHVWKQDDWHVTFTPLPKKPEARGAPGARTIGMHGPGEAYMIDDRTPIWRAVGEKAGAYGRFDKPYIVAVAAQSFTAGNDHDVNGALYGTEQVTLRTRSDGSVEAVSSRAPDGIFLGPHGVRNTRVSGVLIAQHLSPWSVGTTVPTLWHHPAAEQDASVAGCPWRQVTVRTENGELEYHAPSITTSEFFDLPSDWPGFDEWTPDE